MYIRPLTKEMLVHKFFSLFISFSLSLTAYASDLNIIEGKVLDSHSGEPIPNANILIKDSEEGTTTNRRGVFLIETNQDYPITVIVNHIGYSSTEKTAYDSRTLQIDLWPATLELAPVDVSIIRLPSHYDVSSARQSMGSSELRTRAIQDFQEVTRSISSVVISAGMDGSQTISVRGSNANETPVYLDGVKINDSFTNVADLSVINMEDVDNIEVIKGASTLPYEVGAFGGVVNIYSRTPTRSQISLSGSGDLNNSQSGSTAGQVSLVRGPLSLTTQLAQRNRKYQTFFNEFKTERTFGSGMINWEIGSGNLRFKGIRQEAQIRQAEGDGFDTHSKNTFFDMRYTGGLPWLGSDWQMDYGRRYDALGVSFWSLGTSNSNYQQSPEGNSSSMRLAKLMKLENFETLVQLSGGRDYYTGPSSTAIEPIYYKEMNLELSQDTRSITSISKFNIETVVPSIDLLGFELGLRYDDVNTAYHYDDERKYYHAGETVPYRVDTNIEDVFDDHYMVSKRMGLRLDGRIKKLAYSSYMSLGNNFRLPTLQDQYFRQATTVLIYEDLPLLRESVNTVDLGIDFNFQMRPGMPFTHIEGSLSYFDNGYVNKLSYKSSPGQPPIPYNTLAATITGLEVSGKFFLLSKRGHLSFGSIFLDLSDPVVFFGKPSYRHTAGVTLTRGKLTYSGSYWLDGPTVYLSDDGLYEEPKSNLDLSVASSFDWDHALLTTTMSAKNIFNFTETQESLLVNDRGYIITYFDQFQLVLNVSVTLR
jgi:outer membrane receptor protein involved in Fe transport